MKFVVTFMAGSLSYFCFLGVYGRYLSYCHGVIFGQEFQRKMAGDPRAGGAEWAGHSADIRPLSFPRWIMRTTFILFLNRWGALTSQVRRS